MPSLTKNRSTILPGLFQITAIKCLKNLVAGQCGEMTELSLFEELTQAVKFKNSFDDFILTVT